jgi:hypothetical protein
MNKEVSESVDWLEAELRDSIDEMVENELSEPMLSDEIRELYKGRLQNPLGRMIYYRNLLRLQAELIKL